MKYLFSAIDARQARNSSLPHHSLTNGHRVYKRHYDAIELKEMLMSASEGVDEKSSTNDFVDTLERIVNEIKNTSEHSGPFLQKVRKTEVPDYYDVIKKPMDLATLMKRVKSQMYRTKKAFADDLDLIWSNCLLYNSHPAHPLRKTAETLRAKSNQLLEFITDPALPTRNLANVNGRNGARNGKSMTPSGLGDDENSGGEDEGGKEGGKRLVGVAERALGVDGKERSASPAGSRSTTPSGILRNGHHLDSPDSLPVSPQGPPPIPFEESPAIIRSAKVMKAFSVLDHELFNFDQGRGRGKEKVVQMIKDIRGAEETDDEEGEGEVEGEGEEKKPPTGDLEVEKEKEEDLDDLWWHKVVDPSSSAAQPRARARSRGRNLHLLAAGLPKCPFVGSGAVEGVTKGKKKGGKEKGKGKGLGLEEKMKVNVETLKRIRKLHNKLESSKGTEPLEIRPLGGGELSDSSSSETDEDSSLVSMSKRKKTKATTAFGDGARFPKQVYRTAMAEKAGRESLRGSSNMILAHAGFDGSSSTALGVLAHVAAEYMVNLGKTMKMYSDQYGTTMTPEQILLHTLNENGVASPSTLESYVQNGIEQHGSNLTELHTKLTKARNEQLDGVGMTPEEEELAFEKYAAWDGEVFATGEVGYQIGEDYLALAELGLDLELGVPTLRIPLRLYRGVPRGSITEAELGPWRSIEPELQYPPPAPFVPLSAAAIESQIGLLRPFLLLRQKTEGGLVDDILSSVRPRIPRNKVPPTGRIPFKKRKTEEATPIAGGKIKKRKGDESD